jgi:hypothetical protein
MNQFNKHHINTEYCILNQFKKFAITLSLQIALRPLFHDLVELDVDGMATY